MSRGTLAALFAVAFSISGLLRAEDVKPPEQKPEHKTVKKANPERIFPRGPELEKLRADLGLTDEQIATAKEAVAAVSKKNDELLASKDVAAAEEEVKKAKDALKAAEGKFNAAKNNFDLNEEYKKAVLSAVPDDKKDKASELLHYKPKAEKKAEKKDTKKPEEKKAESPAPAASDAPATPAASDAPATPAAPGMENK